MTKNGPRAAHAGEQRLTRAQTSHWSRNTRGFSLFRTGLRRGSTAAAVTIIVPLCTFHAAPASAQDQPVTNISTAAAIPPPAPSPRRLSEAGQAARSGRSWLHALGHHRMGLGMTPPKLAPALPPDDKKTDQAKNCLGAASPTASTAPFRSSSMRLPKDSAMSSCHRPAAHPSTTAVLAA
jgi:hypothetical protein